MPTTSVTLQPSMGKRREKVGFNEFLNDRRHLDAVTSDGKLFSKFLLR